MPGAAVMGSSETRGDNRATKLLKGVASPLLDSKDIMGPRNSVVHHFREEANCKWTN